MLKYMYTHTHTHTHTHIYIYILSNISRVQTMEKEIKNLIYLIKLKAANKLKKTKKKTNWKVVAHINNK